MREPRPALRRADGAPSFFGEALEDDIMILDSDGVPQLYAPALKDVDRIRLQTDMIVKF